jgi:hypothetical protein
MSGDEEHGLSIRALRGNVPRRCPRVERTGVQQPGNSGRLRRGRRNKVLDKRRRQRRNRTEFRGYHNQ